jgi:hypothetical protein
LNNVSKTDITFPTTVKKFMLNIEKEIKGSLDLIKTNMRQYLISYDAVKKEIVNKVNFITIINFFILDESYR